MKGYLFSNCPPPVDLYNPPLICRYGSISFDAVLGRNVIPDLHDALLQCVNWVMSPFACAELWGPLQASLSIQLSNQESQSVASGGHTDLSQKSEKCFKSWVVRRGCWRAIKHEAEVAAVSAVKVIHFASEMRTNSRWLVCFMCPSREWIHHVLIHQNKSCSTP